MMDTVKNEPVLTAAVIAPIVVWLGAYFGLSMDAETATALSTLILAVGGWYARQKVKPTRKG